MANNAAGFLNDQAELFQQLLHCETFDATTSLLFKHANLVDDRFLDLLNQSPSPYREMIYEALLQSRGLLEDPELIGPYEEWLVDRTVKLTVPPEGPAWLASQEPVAISPEEIESLLDLAVRRMQFNGSYSAWPLAIVHYAMRRVARAAPSSADRDRAEYLRALGDVARGRILVNVIGRAFDAIEYLQQALQSLEVLHHRSDSQAKKPLETLMIQISNQILDAQSLLLLEKE